MGDHAMLAPPRGRRGDPARRVHARPRPDHRADHRARRPVAVRQGSRAARCTRRAATTGPRPMNMAEKILAAKLYGRAAGAPAYVKPGDAVMRARRRRLLARVHHRAGPLLPREGVRRRLQAGGPGEVRGLRGPPHLRRRRAGDGAVRRQDREAARDAARVPAKTGVRDFSAVDGVSPGICHQVAREQIIEPGDFIQATDSHTCMGGASGALAYGVGATEYAALVHSGFTPFVGARVDPLRARRRAARRASRPRT